MSDYVNICHDQKRSVRLDKSHGPWWLTFVMPLGRKHRLYVGASTGERFARTKRIPDGTRRLFQSSHLVVSLIRGRSRPSISIHRWCAHIDVSNEPTTPTPPTTAPREDDER